jgi:hypothetical protein
MPALTAAAESALATQTTLSAETSVQNGHTQATVEVAVTGEDGQPATGAVTISDKGKPLAGATLSAEGQAKIVVDLAAGRHHLTAQYVGDDTHESSVSPVADVAAAPTVTPDFQVSLAAVTPTTFPLTVTAGTAGTVAVAITPSNATALTAPMFVTISCSGLPDQTACIATPENLEILSTTTTAPTSDIVIQTYAASTKTASTHKANPIAWAILLPGMFGLGGLAWGFRRKPWLSRLSLVALIALVTTLGTTGCNPRYGYENHSPTPNPGTPLGSYTVTVNAQSTNGVTAISHSATFVLTVK